MGRQEERGSVRVNVMWSVKCLVLSDRWPSWSCALQALQVENLRTVVVNASDEAMKELQGTSVAASMMKFDGNLERVKDSLTPST